MTRRSSLTILLVLTFAAAAFAGTIEGKVSPGNSVVYIDAAQGQTFSASTQHVVLSQKGLMFNPHVLVVQQGTTVEFENDDTVQHNVFWPSVGGNKKEGHNLGTWPKSEKRSFQFNTPGVVPLLCNVHPEMSGYIVVTPAPYFVQADGSGNYKIDNLPDGKYHVAAWHEGMKPQTKLVDVAGKATADYALSK